MPTKKSGAEFQIECVANTIKLKESMGKDASGERELLKAWSKYKGWELAGTILSSSRIGVTPKKGRSK